MASRTGVTEARRKAKHRKMGAKRKAADRNKGTTPKFAVHEGGKPKVAKEAAPKAVAIKKAPSAKKVVAPKVKAPKAPKVKAEAAPAPKKEKKAAPTK
jgi:hypothetical protein